MEARKYQVLPFDASALTRFVAPRPNITAGRTEFNYTTPITGIPSGDAPSHLNTSYTITADIDVPAGGAEGMLMTQGGRLGGWGFCLVKGKPVFTWNLVDLQRVRWEGPVQLAPGKHTVVFDFKYDGLGARTLAFNSVSGIGQGGTGVLKVDGKDGTPKRWSEPSRSSFNGTRHSTAGPTKAPVLTIATTRCRSLSPARHSVVFHCDTLRSNRCGVRSQHLRGPYEYTNRILQLWPTHRDNLRRPGSRRGLPLLGMPAAHWQCLRCPSTLSH